MWSGRKWSSHISLKSDGSLSVSLNAASHTLTLLGSCGKLKNLLGVVPVSFPLSCLFGHPRTTHFTIFATHLFTNFLEVTWIVVTHVTGNVTSVVPHARKCDHVDTRHPMRFGADRGLLLLLSSSCGALAAHDLHCSLLHGRCSHRIDAPFSMKTQYVAYILIVYI